MRNAEGEPGEVYNVASGRALAIASVLDQLVALTGRPIATREDPALFRPVDVPLLVGDASRLSEATGWRPEVPFEQTLADVLADWRARIDKSSS